MRRLVHPTIAAARDANGSTRVKPDLDRFLGPPHGEEGRLPLSGGAETTAHAAGPEPRARRRLYRPKPLRLRCVRVTPARRGLAAGRRLPLGVMGDMTSPTRLLGRLAQDLNAKGCPPGAGP